MTSSLFADEERLARLDKLNEPLFKLNQHVDFDLIAAQVDEACPRPSRAKGGRPPYPTVLMVRALVIKYLWNMSFDQLEIHLLDRMTLQRFVGLQGSSSIPDAKTLWLFHERLVQAGVADVIFNNFSRQLLNAGYWARGGQLVDATLIPAPIQRNSRDDNKRIKQGDIPEDWSANKRRQKDTDASWTRKHNKNHFGYKGSANVDKRCKLIRKIHVSTASESDQKHIELILDPMNTSKTLYGDRGYTMTNDLANQGISDGIQRRAPHKQKLSECQKRRNHRLAKTRARVEHVFGGLAQMGGKFVRSIGIKRATFAIKMQATVYNMKRLTFLANGGLNPF
jgi:IS5 family transposase